MRLIKGERKIKTKLKVHGVIIIIKKSILKWFSPSLCKDYTYLKYYFQVNT